jgi:sterol 24-C-methyltransferase
MMTTNPASLLYRVPTIWQAFKAVYKLEPAKVDAFVNAYGIYDCDWIEGKAIKDSRPVDYQEIKQGLLDWYGVINHLCAMCEVEKMYIPPSIDPSQRVISNQILFERKFCRDLGMKPGDKVLELGCGKGRVAAHLAGFSGAHITGINIDQGQLDNAVHFAGKNDLSQRCCFINGDFNELPFSFADNSFDHAYEIQALSLCRDLEKLFAELHRIIKPGGKLSLLEWVRLPNFDAQNPQHLAIMKKVKPLIGAIGTPSPAEYEAMLRQAGFEVFISEDPSVNHRQGPLIDNAGSNFDKYLPLIKGLVKIKVLPKHFITLIDKLQENVDALSEADREGLFTMSYHIVAQKKQVH